MAFQDSKWGTLDKNLNLLKFLNLFKLSCNMSKPKAFFKISGLGKYFTDHWVKVKHFICFNYLTKSLFNLNVCQFFLITLLLLSYVPHVIADHPMLEFYQWQLFNLHPMKLTNYRSSMASSFSIWARDRKWSSLGSISSYPLIHICV